jgi:DNA-binding transcriptional LysR family regulator
MSWGRQPNRRRPGTTREKDCKTVEINQIRYFLALCAERSFTRAARSCAVAQPTVTNGIRALEREVGGPLFYRKRQSTLTALGEAIHPHLKRVIKEIELARAAGARLAPNARIQLANVELGAGPSEIECGGARDSAMR